MYRQYRLYKKYHALDYHGSHDTYIEALHYWKSWTDSVKDKYKSLVIVMKDDEQIPFGKLLNDSNRLDKAYARRLK